MDSNSPAPAPAPLLGYIVSVRFQHPAHDERNGFQYVFTARSKAQACRYARRQFRDDGHVGRAFFTAVLNPNLNQ